MWCYTIFRVRNVLIAILVRGLETMFLVGMAGSAVVLVLTTIEDLRMIGDAGKQDSH